MYKPQFVCCAFNIFRVRVWNLTHQKYVVFDFSISFWPIILAFIYCRWVFFFRGNRLLFYFLYLISIIFSNWSRARCWTPSGTLRRLSSERTKLLKWLNSGIQRRAASECKIKFLMFKNGISFWKFHTSQIQVSHLHLKSFRSFDLSGDTLKDFKLWVQSDKNYCKVDRIIRYNFHRITIVSSQVSPSVSFGLDYIKGSKFDEKIIL